MTGCSGCALPTCGVHSVEHQLVVDRPVGTQEAAAAVCTGWQGRREGAAVSPGLASYYASKGSAHGPWGEG